tara:strand:- start:116 stop:550 length:435 start_codon:yes stop_codon:yes gene_type:complete
MPVTMTSNYKEVFSKEVVEKIEDLSEYSYELEDLIEFVDTYGEDKFEYVEDYLDVVNNIFCDDPKDVVDRYVEETGIEYIQGADEMYEGNYESVEQFIDDRELIDHEIPSWIVIDYEATWDSALRFDFEKIDDPNFGYDFWRIN